MGSYSIYPNKDVLEEIPPWLLTAISTAGNPLEMQFIFSDEAQFLKNGTS